MKNILTLILLTISLSSFGQVFPQPVKGFFGKIQFQNFSTGGSADATGTLNNFNDQTVQDHLINQVLAGDIIFDQSGNVWEVAVVNSTTIFNASVDLWKVVGTGNIPFGSGNIARPTTNLQLVPTSTVNAIGIAQKVAAEIENYNMWKIDQIQTAGATFSGDTIYFSDNQTIFLPSYDTDTFAILIDSIVYFPDGQSFDLSNIDNNAEALDYYDAGLGFYVMASPGVTVTSSSAGMYAMNIPNTTQIEYYHKNFTTANIGTELDGSGNYMLTSNFNQDNTGWNDATLPTVHAFTNGQQYYLGATGQSSTTGVNVQVSTPSGGSYTTTFTGVSGVVAGSSMQVKGTF